MASDFQGNLSIQKIGFSNCITKYLLFFQLKVELKVVSTSRRDGIWDFLDRYGYHYGDGFAHPLLPSELSGADNSKENS